jgi:hypothetical protein
VGFAGGGGAVRACDMLNKPPEDTPLARRRYWVQGVAIRSDDSPIVSGSADGTFNYGRGQPTWVRESVASSPRTESHAVGPWLQSKIPYDELCPNPAVAPDVRGCAGA